MTKKELINKLKGYPDNSEVFVWVDDQQFAYHITSIGNILDHNNKKSAPIIYLDNEY